MNSLKCYKAFPNLKPWRSAERFCLHGGGSLAEPKSTSIVFSVLEAINLQSSPGKYWIGGKRSESNNNFVWASDDSTVGDAHWAEGFPELGSGCISQTAPDGYMRNYYCGQLNYFICELNENTVFNTPVEGTHNIFNNVFNILHKQ